MSQWGNQDNASNSVNYGTKLLWTGSGVANIAGNNTSLYINTTPDAFVNGWVAGQWAVNPTELTAGGGESNSVTAAGWQLRTVGEGPILTLVAANGAAFANGETVVLSNGTVNAVVTLTTNATGNLVSGVLTSPGQFVNTSIIALNFQRQQHILTFTATAGLIIGTGNVGYAAAKTVGTGNVTYTGTATGYSNTDYIVVTNSAFGTVNAVANIATNATGGTLTFTFSNVGFFTPAITNTQVVITAYAANGAASNGTGATFTSANLITIASTGVNGYSNNDVLTVSYPAFGVINAIANVSTNTLGGTLTFTFSNTGLFPPATPNTSLQITIANNSGGKSNGYGAFFTSANQVAATITGYNNTNILVASNGLYSAVGGNVANILYGGVGNLTTNATGGTIINMNVISVGLFGNAAVNTSVNVIAYAANLTSISNGFGSFFSANLTTSTTGNIQNITLGGRAGRVQYECLVAMSSIVTTGANTTIPTSN